MRKTHDYIHYYRGYWFDGGKCRIRISRLVLGDKVYAEVTGSLLSLDVGER